MQVTTGLVRNHSCNCGDTIPITYYIPKIPLVFEVNGVPTSQGRSASISETGHKEAQDA